MALTNVDDIVNRLVKVIKAYSTSAQPKPSSVIHDAFVLPAATAMAWDVTLLTYTQAIQSLSKILTLEADSDFLLALAEALSISQDSALSLLSLAIERIGANYGITRKAATAAYGTVWFYTTTAPSSDQTISTTTVSAATGISFSSSDTVVLPSDGVADYYDPALSAYAVPAAVTCTTTGTGGRVAAESLTIASGLPSGFSVTNKYAIETGNDLETDSELVDRIQTAIRGISRQTADGIKTVITSKLDVREVKIADAQSAYQLRNNGRGGVVDIYIADVLPVQVTQTMTASGTVIFENQPVMDISSVVSGSTTYVKGTDYTLVADTNVLTKDSVRSTDYIHWLTTKPTADYTVAYIYNEMLTSVQDLVTSDTYRPLMGDVKTAILTRQGTRVDIEIGFNVTTYAKYSRSTVLTSATLAVQKYVAGLGFGDSLAQSDIIAVIEAVSGVNYVTTTPLAFNIVGGDIEDPITVGTYEYLRASSITLE